MMHEKVLHFDEKMLMLHKKKFNVKKTGFCCTKKVSCQNNQVSAAQKKFHVKKQVSAAQKKFHVKKNRFLLHKKKFHLQKSYYFFPERRAIVKSTYSSQLIYSAMQVEFYMSFYIDLVQGESTQLNIQLTEPLQQLLYLNVQCITWKVPKGYSYNFVGGFIT